MPETYWPPGKVLRRSKNRFERTMVTRRGVQPAQPQAWRNETTRVVFVPNGSGVAIRVNQTPRSVGFASHFLSTAERAAGKIGFAR